MEHPADEGERIIHTVGDLLDALADVPRARPLAALARARSKSGTLGDLRSVLVDTSRSNLVVLEPVDDAPSALVAAVESGDVQRARDLVDAGADVNERDRRGVLFDGATPLTIAANRGDLPLTRLLVEGGADVNAHSISGWTALMRACNAGHLEVARFLLQAGADPFAKNDEGYTARGRIQGTHAELLELLEEAEAAR